MRYNVILTSLLAATLFCNPFASFASEKDGEGRLIGAWMFTCSDGPCRAFIGVMEGETSRLVLSIQKDQETGRALLAVHAPLGTILPPGVRVFTTGDHFASLPFQICQADGCDAVVLLDDELRNRLSQTGVARVAFFLQTDPAEKPEGREFDVPVHGISDAIEALIIGQD